MVPFYIIIPITGIILLFQGFNTAKGHGRKRIGFGLFLLSLPFLHYLLFDQFEKRNEKSIMGSYTLDSTRQTVLKLHPDKTFELAKLDSIKSFGKGKWQYCRWDVDEVNLTFPDSSQLSFVVFLKDDSKYLQNTFSTGTKSNIEDADFIALSFASADLVYCMVPPINEVQSFFLLNRRLSTPLLFR